MEEFHTPLIRFTFLAFWWFQCSCKWCYVKNFQSVYCWNIENKVDFLFFKVCVYFWLHRVLLALRLSLVAGRGATLQVQGPGVSFWWPLSLQSIGPRHAGSGAAARGLSKCQTHWLSCRGRWNLPEEESNLHWHVDFQALDHQREIPLLFLIY